MNEEDVFFYQAYVPFQKTGKKQSVQKFVNKCHKKLK